MRHHLGKTWIDPEELAYNTYGGSPSGSGRRGKVRFPDGKLRIVRLGVPDTACTIPAKPSRGRVGFIMVDQPVGEDPKEYLFRPRA
jgi:hypothetical protein